MGGAPDVKGKVAILITRHCHQSSKAWDHNSTVWERIIAHETPNAG